MLGVLNLVTLQSTCGHLEILAQMGDKIRADKSESDKRDKIFSVWLGRSGG